MRLESSAAAPPLRLSSRVGVRPTERMRSSIAFACARLVPGVSASFTQPYNKLTPGASPVRCGSFPILSGRCRPGPAQALRSTISMCLDDDPRKMDMPEVLSSRCSRYASLTRHLASMPHTSTVKLSTSTNGWVCQLDPNSHAANGAHQWVKASELGHAPTRPDKSLLVLAV